MTSQANRSPSALRNVLYEISMAKDVPDVELLDEFVRRFPEYAEAITAFVIEVVAEAIRAKSTPAVETTTAVSPEVSRAMSTYQNALFAKAAKGKTAAVQEVVQANSSECPNLFAALDRQSFRAMAAALKMNTVLLIKLRDRQIDPATLTEGFKRFVADTLQVAKDVVDTFFGEQTPRLAVQFFKSETKPETQAQQSFKAAVRASGLSDSQQNFLLEL
jgi:hypothetical protein